VSFSSSKPRDAKLKLSIKEADLSGVYASATAKAEIDD
jgi:hypothetical protein